MTQVVDEVKSDIAVTEQAMVSQAMRESCGSTDPEIIDLSTAELLVVVLYRVYVCSITLCALFSVHHSR